MNKICLDTENDIFLELEVIDGKISASLFFPNSSEKSKIFKNFEKMIGNNYEVSEEDIKNRRINLPEQCIEYDEGIGIRIGEYYIVQGLMISPEGKIVQYDSEGKLTEEIEPGFKILSPIKVQLGQVDPSAQNPQLFIDEGTKSFGEYEIKTDVHNHIAGMLSPERLVALGLKHNVDYSMLMIQQNGIELDNNQKRVVIHSFVNALKESGNYEEILKKYEEYLDNTKSDEEISKCFDEIMSLNLKEYGKIAEDDIKLKFQDLIITYDRNGLNLDNLQKILLSLRLPLDRQAVFSELEYVYDSRDPFTKGNGNELSSNIEEIETLLNAASEEHVEFLELAQNFDEVTCSRNYDEIGMDSKKFGDESLQQDILFWIAKEAKEQGITYIETSQAALAKGGKKSEDYLEIMEILDEIQDKIGVDIRFLAAVRRNFDKVKDFQDSALQVIKSAGTSKRVVGLDIMGEELNETEHFATVIEEISRYAQEKDPSFVLRVHAGENTSLKSNIKQVLEIVKKTLPIKENGEVDYSKCPQIRIGHGLYGVERDKNGNLTPESEELLKLMKDMGVIVELNLTSNVRLNNLNATDVAAKLNELMELYTKNGVGICLGTDGYGIYGTNSQNELKFALGSLRGNTEFEQLISQTEQRIIAQTETRDNYWKENKETENVRNVVQNDNSQKEHLKECRRVIKDKLNAGKLQYKKMDAIIESGKKVMVIAGGSFGEFNENESQELNDEERKLLDEIFEEVKINHHEYQFVIGHSGARQEKYILNKVLEHNELHPGEKVDLTMVFPKTVMSERLGDAYTQLENKQIAEMHELLANVENISYMMSSLDETTGSYKVFSEIFNNIDFSLFAFEGKAPLQNLIQAALSSAQKSEIFLNLQNKAARSKNVGRRDGKQKLYCIDLKADSDGVTECMGTKVVTIENIINILKNRLIKKDKGNNQQQQDTNDWR